MEPVSSVEPPEPKSPEFSFTTSDFVRYELREDYSDVGLANRIRFATERVSVSLDLISFAISRFHFILFRKHRELGKLAGTRLPTSI
ncbi:MAG: hypothetical protein R3A47_03680 [Polyangiales bacterium]